jgi:hypothetical protein
MMRKALMIAAMFAALTTAAPIVSAEGICVCGMKRPLRADGLHHLKRPLLACNQNLCHVKRPLVQMA